MGYSVTKVTKVKHNMLRFNQNVILKDFFIFLTGRSSDFKKRKLYSYLNLSKVEL